MILNNPMHDMYQHTQYEIADNETRKIQSKRPESLTGGSGAENEVFQGSVF